MPLCNVLQDLWVTSCPKILIAASLGLKPTRTPESRFLYTELMMSDQILEALEGCNWEIVYLRMKSNEAKAEARRIASSEGIKLYIYQ
jgi:hypothetical protein